MYVSRKCCLLFKSVAYIQVHFILDFSIDANTSKFAPNGQVWSGMILPLSNLSLGCGLGMGACVNIRQTHMSHDMRLICATRKGSDQSAHTRRLIRAFASRLNVLWMLSYWTNSIWSSISHARLSLHLSKCHIVGNHISRLICKNGYLLMLQLTLSSSF